MDPSDENFEENLDKLKYKKLKKLGLKEFEKFDGTSK